MKSFLFRRWSWVAGLSLFWPMLAQAQNTPNLAEMFANFSDSSVALMNLVRAGAFVIGLVITGVGLFRLKQMSESQGRIGFFQPVMLLLVGSCLVALPGFIDVATETMALGSDSGTSLLAEPTTGGGVPGMSAAIKGVLLFVKLVGTLAFVRGFLILKDVGEGKQNAGMGRALTHIFGGAAAININATIAVLGATFAPGMNLSGLGG